MPDDTAAQPSWTQRLAAATGFEAVARRLTGERSHAPVLFIAFLICIDLVVVPYQYVLQHGTHPLIERPITVLIGTSLLFAAWAGQYLRHQYDAHVADIIEVDDGLDYGDFRSPYLRALPYLLAGAAAAVHGYWIVTSGLSYYTGLYGTVPALFLALVVQPLYLIMLVDLATIILQIHVFLPYVVRREGLDIDYHNPVSFDGVESFGELVRTSSGIYFLGLTLYSVILATRALNGRVIPPTDYLYVGVAGGGGLLLFLFPVLWVRNYMKAEKEKTQQEITAKINQFVQENDMPDFEHPESNPEDVNEFMERGKKFRKYSSLYFKLDRIEKAPHVPVSYRKARAVIMLAVLPFLLNLLAAIAQHYLL